MDEIARDIKRFWGSSLTRISSELISGYSLSTTNYRILSEVGLPLVDDLITFYEDSMIKEYCADNDRFLVIGDDYGTKIGIALNAETNNEVYSFDINEDLPKRFINSDMAKFLQFIMWYSNFKPSIIGLEEDEVGPVIAGIKDDFNKVDFLALAGEENWWSVILEQHEMGIC
jgi:hypothetical protein